MIIRKILYLQPINADLVHTTGFRKEEVVTMPLKFGVSGTPVKSIV
jgi:hypothetical protein